MSAMHRQGFTCWGAGRQASTAPLEQACRESTAWLADRCRKVIILSQDPILPIEDAADNGPEIWKLFRDNHNSLPKFSEDCAAREARQLSASLLRRAADPRVLIVDAAAPVQNSDGSIRYFTSAGALYRDNHHLNPLAAMELIPFSARNCTILRDGSVYLIDEPRV
jgi:hypothetical protein